ncbi:hypothetical protein D3C80_715010 [compost metagenome]
MRIFRHTPFGGRNTDTVEQPACFGEGLGIGKITMPFQGFRELEADGQNRIEAGHRLLEDHCRLITAQGLHGLRRQIEHIAAVEQYPAVDPACRIGQEPHDCKSRNALA